MDVFHLVNILLIAKIFSSDASNSSPNPRIVNGYSVDIKDFPYMVSIQRITRGYQAVFNHHCGGIIISNEAVLTAAHCVGDVPLWKWIIRAGSTYVNQGFRSYSPEGVLVHPLFDRGNLDYDFAIAFLDQKFKFQDKILPITLAPKNFPLLDGAAVTVVGWGRTNYYDDTETPPELQAAEVYIVNHHYCRDTYGTYYDVTDTMICANAVGKLPRDSCNGDSGGPLIRDSLLVGVTSWGYKCAVRTSPGVYAKVSVAYDWIVENVPDVQVADMD